MGDVMARGWVRAVLLLLLLAALLGGAWLVAWAVDESDPSGHRGDPLACSDGEPAFAAAGVAPVPPAPPAPPGTTAQVPAGPTLEGAPRATPMPRPTARRSVADTLALLRGTRGWIKTLEAWLSLPAADNATERSRRRAAVLTGLADPVVRQNTIFLAALMEPWEEVRPWLETLRVGNDPDDAEDALCALAFSGDERAIEAFRGLARVPSGAPVHRLLDDADEADNLAVKGTREAREILRAWRSIEALDGEPYFKIVKFSATRWGRLSDSLHWLPRKPSAEAREALLVAWLARYPGHPGSDNVAIRLGDLRSEAQDPYHAAQWYARALALPDQHEAWDAAFGLVDLAETALEPEQLLTLANDGGREAPSRTLLLYAHARRTASGRSFEASCRELENLSREEPDLVLSVAWRNRWSVQAPKGLDSGLEPLPGDDPLRRVEVAPAVWPAPRRMAYDGTPARVGPWTRPWDGDERLRPVTDPGVLDRDRLVRQLRAWDALAELERRAALARGTAQADLLYKQAAVLYHDRDALYPVYLQHVWTRSIYPYLANSAWSPALPEEKRRAVEAQRARVGTETFAWERAAAVFRGIEQQHPDYPALDKVLFSEGMCWKRLVDYRPRGGALWNWESQNVAAAKEAVACFDRLARDFPKSPLADDAERAAAWWRRARPAGWRDQR
jgi:hypothetical protein